MLSAATRGRARRLIAEGLTRHAELGIAILPASFLARDFEGTAGSEFSGTAEAAPVSIFACRLREFSGLDEIHIISRNRCCNHSSGHEQTNACEVSRLIPDGRPTGSKDGVSLRIPWPHEVCVMTKDATATGSAANSLIHWCPRGVDPTTLTPVAILASFWKPRGCCGGGATSPSETF
jgi:hypothetical protein